MSLYVTDTHALVWYATGASRRLGTRARAAFQAADEGRAAIYIPALVVTELLEASQRGVVRFTRSASEWVEQVFSTGNFIFADLTLPVVMAESTLHGVPERGDRLIAATALALGYPLLTRDPAIAAAGVDTLW